MSSVFGMVGIGPTTENSQVSATFGVRGNRTAIDSRR